MPQLHTANLNALLRRARIQESLEATFKAGGRPMTKEESVDWSRAPATIATQGFLPADEVANYLAGGADGVQGGAPQRQLAANRDL